MLKNLVVFCSNIMYFVDRFVTISYGRMEQQSKRRLMKMDEFTVIAILTVSVVVGKFVNYLHTARTKKSCKWLGIVIAFAVDVLALFTVPVPKPEVYPAGGILNSYSQGIFINSTSSVLTSYYTTDSITDRTNHSARPCRDLHFHPARYCHCSPLRQFCHRQLGYSHPAGCTALTGWPHPGK